MIAYVVLNGDYAACCKLLMHVPVVDWQLSIDFLLSDGSGF